MKEPDRTRSPEGGAIALEACYVFFYFLEEEKEDEEEVRGEAEVQQLVLAVAEDGSEVSQNRAGSVSFCRPLDQFSSSAAGSSLSQS